MSSSLNPENISASIGAAVLQSRMGPSTSDAPSLSSIAEDLSQETLDLIETVRQQYNFNGSFFSIAEREVIINEFLLTLQEVKFRTQIVYPRAVCYFFFQFSQFDF